MRKSETRAAAAEILRVSSRGRSNSAQRGLLWIGLGLGGLIAVLAQAAAVHAGRQAFPGRNGKIVFVGQFPGTDSELYSIDADGSRRRRLTFDGLAKLAPAWSPDGRKIAYAAATGENSTDIFVINADGDEQTAADARSDGVQRRMVG
jgi:dipeptidyl aminopeptidase/acylaminoacyl peptidase